MLNIFAFLSLALLCYSASATVTKLPNEQEGQLAGVIVTISGGSSYDPLFTSVPQKAPEGSRVDVYSVSEDALPHIVALLDDHSYRAESIIQEIVTAIRSLEKESIVFNWECSGSLAHGDTYHFEKGAIKLIRFLLDRGYLLMFSDFAVKALITDWDPSHLGPNPLIQFGGFHSSFELAFSPEELKTSGSSQLQKLGELSPDGKAIVKAMSDTIAFTVDESVAESVEAKSRYELKVLTIATRLNDDRVFESAKGHILSLGDRKGVAGHVLITYPSKGKLLLSCGHWIELSYIHTSEELFLSSSEKYYGKAYTNILSQTLILSENDEERASLLQSYSARLVQESSPGWYSSDRQEDEKDL